VIYYEKPAEWWPESIKRFDGSAGSKAIVTDAEEAGKCYALERPTACVFHLMRIVEVGVQEFGLKVGYTLAPDKVWDTILIEIKKAISGLAPSKQKDDYEGLVPYLDSVRRVWRNNVMHPKDEYTQEQAGEILLATRAFMEHLATVI
jgi:hypothetical protein